MVNPIPSGRGGLTGTPMTWTDFLTRPTAAIWRIPTLEQTG